METSEATFMEQAVMNEEDDDLELLERWRDGDRAAGDTLVRRHYAAVYGLVRRRVGDPTHTADIVQETFATIVRTREVIRYDFRRYAYWVVGLKILDYRRAQRRTGHERLPSSVRLAERARGMSSMLRESEGLQDVIAAYYRLSAEDQCLLAWKHFDDRTQRELAELQGVNEAQMAGHLRRARQRWRSELERGEGSPSSSSERTLESWMESMYSKSPPGGRE